MQRKEREPEGKEEKKGNLSRFLLVTGAMDQNQNAPAVNDPPIVTVSPGPEPAPTVKPAQPAAAAIVIEGKTPREIELEARLEEANKTIKEKDFSLADLQDKHHQLKKALAPSPRPKKKSTLEAFLDGEA